MHSTSYAIDVRTLPVLAMLACSSSHGNTVAGPARLEEKLLVEPVRVARVWTTALTPNKQGGWNFIAQTYEYPSENPTEFVVIDLQTGKFTIDEGPAGAYANSNYQIDEQLRAPNGRIFFLEANSHIAFYDPVDEHVHQVSGLEGLAHDTMPFRAVFATDGKLYGGTQSTGLPTIFRLDPETLQVDILGHVGEHRLTYSYAYYLAVDLPWVYVAVGENPWELSALDVRTGASKVLASRDGDGFMQLDARPDGITATLISKLRTAAQQSDIVWCVDGALVRFDPAQRNDKLPFRARDVRFASSVMRRPEVDLERVVPDSRGVGRLRWRWPTGRWMEVTFNVKHTTTVAIESLIVLADGSLLGNARQYHDFFRFDPRRGTTQLLGASPISGGPRVLVDGEVYMSGYPGGALYRYDPRGSWPPEKLGSFEAARTHYAYFLEPDRAGRLYYAGRRERDGIGGGVGYYEPATHRFGGHYDGLSFLDPQGLVVLDAAHVVVYSGRLHDDPARPRATPKSAELVFFDPDLHEIGRAAVRDGLTNTGTIFRGGRPNTIIGVTRSPCAIYIYDVVARHLVQWRAVAGKIGPFARGPDGSIWLVQDRTLMRIDSTTLAMQRFGDLTEVPGDDDLIVPAADGTLYWATGSQIREIALGHH